MPPFADVLQWEHLPFPKSLPSFQKLFPDSSACAAYLERVRWPAGFTCPLCNTKGEPSANEDDMSTADALEDEREAHQVCVEMLNDAAAEIKRLRAALTYIANNGEHMSGTSCSDYATRALEQCGDR